MSEAFIGEIRIFAGNFAPQDWAFCDGQILPIAQNTALYSILGPVYGGDGRTTFALPNLSGRAPMQQGAGPGLTYRNLGEVGGQASTTLTTDQMPHHTHEVRSQSSPSLSTPENTVWANTQGLRAPFMYRTDSNTTMHPAAIAPEGGNLPHNNRQPYVGLNYIICLRGIFPPRQ